VETGVDVAFDERLENAAIFHLSEFSHQKILFFGDHVFAPQIAQPELCGGRLLPEPRTGNEWALTLLSAI
jgi:hypothetical protein